jgi:hypothetical protein
LKEDARKKDESLDFEQSLATTLLGGLLMVVGSPPKIGEFVDPLWNQPRLEMPWNQQEGPKR